MYVNSPGRDSGLSSESACLAISYSMIITHDIASAIPEYTIP